MSIAPDPVSYWRDELLPVGPCKKKLTVLWLILGIFVLGVLMIRSIVGAFGSDINSVWSWFLPNVIPTLMLMAGILVVDDAKRRGRKDEEPKPEPEASGFLYRTAFALSVLHLVGLLALIVYEAMPGSPRMTELTKLVGYLSAPLQGIIAAFLGAFFSK